MSEFPSMTCGRCGSSRIRHARSHNFLHRWVRAWTDLDRYACGSCGHRGWRRGRLPRRAHTNPLPPATTGGRPLERRDRRIRRRVRLRSLATIAVGLLLGALAAWFVLRMARMGPPRLPE